VVTVQLRVVLQRSTLEHVKSAVVDVLRARLLDGRRSPRQDVVAVNTRLLSVSRRQRRRRRNVPCRFRSRSRYDLVTRQSYTSVVKSHMRMYVRRATWTPV